MAGISKRILANTVRRKDSQAFTPSETAMATDRLAAGGYGTPSLAIPKIDTAIDRRTRGNCDIGM